MVQHDDNSVVSVRSDAETVDHDDWFQLFVLITLGIIGASFASLAAFFLAQLIYEKVQLPTVDLATVIGSVLGPVLLGAASLVYFGAIILQMKENSALPIGVKRTKDAVGSAWLAVGGEFPKQLQNIDNDFATLILEAREENPNADVSDLIRQRRCVKAKTCLKWTWILVGYIIRQAVTIQLARFVRSLFFGV